MEQELIIFNKKNKNKNKLPSFSLLINPETLTLTWKKVVNRVRTKTRLVTLFWGEDPVKFTYNGQTGYIKPYTKLWGDARSVEAYNKDQIEKSAAISNHISKLEGQITAGGPYSQGSAKGNLQEILAYRQELKGVRLIQPGELLDIAGEKKTNTDVLLVSEKFQQLKKLEKLYTKHQDPNYLIDVQYRKYIFEGYFESFSFTDDARNPWNWRYVIDFTILTWQELASPITSQEEWLFITVDKEKDTITGEFKR